jgi:hypothetical protein
MADTQGGEEVPAGPPADRRPYLLLYLIALLFYVAVWGLLNYVTEPDTKDYLELGRGVFSQGVFGFADSGGIHHPGAFRMPVFPLVMGALAALLGDAEVAAYAYSLLQLLFAPVLPCTAFYFGSRLSRGTGIAAFVFILAHLSVAKMSVSVITDTMFAAASGCTFVLAWRAVEVASPRRWAAAGAMIGVACLVRPIMKLYPLLMVCFAPLIRGWRVPRLLSAYGLLLLAFGAVMTPWVARSVYLYGRPVLETNQGLNLLWTNRNLVRQLPGDDEETRSLKRWVTNDMPSPMELCYYRSRDYWIANDLKVSDELQGVAVSVLRDNPVGVMRNWLSNFAHMTFSLNHYDVMHQLALSRPAYGALRRAPVWRAETFVRRFDNAYWELYRVVKWSYLAVAWIGLALIFWRNWRLGAFMLLNILYFTGLTAFVAGYDRYRLNIECLYAVAIVVPLMTLVEWSCRQIRCRRSGTVGPV